MREKRVSDQQTDPSLLRFEGHFLFRSRAKSLPRLTDPLHQNPNIQNRKVAGISELI